MRDDIHKKVPRPPKVQRWVRLSVNDADRLAGRGFDGFQDAMHDACRRDLGAGFIAELKKALNGPGGLFGHLSDAASPRDLRGRGGPAEWEVLTEAKRLVATGVSPQTIAQRAVETVMKNRADADIRVTAAVLPRYDKKTAVLLESMKSDARRMDYKALAASVCSGQIYERSNRSAGALDLDGDLRGGGNR
ncbi:hypothetical protein GPL17_35955 [Bradyrhizobium yuanmingense]|uniref:hypothetical protein n=1 Tax=Bradyrhizobium yuanmingense TaxID=108015 RepID=UPI0012F7C5C2|nr:hypothetical protein [Bradyrhizobium yuanmingense]MDF0522193.1 hypothetical protein [Bradyrhizobium yuanmingense]MVT55794.1 hypothetical protein [Bradyrhizobium yuanmingense]